MKMKQNWIVATVKEITIQSKDLSIQRGSSFFFTSVATGSFLNQVIILLVPILLGSNITKKQKMPIMCQMEGSQILPYPRNHQQGQTLLEATPIDQQ